MDAVCLGITVADVFCTPLDSMPKPGHVSRTEKIELLAGGCATNTAIDLAKIGMKVGLIGKVGSDIFGKFLIDEISDSGVDTSRVRVSDGFPTSTTMVILSKKEDRRYIHSVGANADFRVKDIDIEYILKAKVFYVGGYLVLPGLDGKPMETVLKAAKKRGITTVVDVVVVWHDSLAEKCKRILPYVDVFLPNNDEAYAITGKDDVQKQADVLLGWGANTVVITMGEKGAFIKTRDGRRVSSSIYKVKSVDPSGAGDAFDAGFVTGILKNWDLVKTLKFASAIAASCVMEVGANRGIFVMEKALEFINRNNIDIKINPGRRLA
jgi:sugar/nucleoside kinase (ribokinase family)